MYDDAAKSASPSSLGKSSECQSIEWYAEGQARVVEVGGVQIVVRFVGRRGRRARIAIIAPPGTVFSASDAEGRASGHLG